MNLLDLFIKVGVDDGEVDKKLGDTTGKASGLADKLKTGLATAAKVGMAAVGAAATAVGALAKTSIENFAEYEQLVGGVETLFESSADTVSRYADNAYKTAGLSANEYMATVTGFSASLLQSLGGDTEAAAEMADMAITDMADNANKMGTDMASIQTAYQGFAKQNYTMLDNLKLGYGGTKEEMQRLLEDATALSGVEYDVSSYADLVDAIHIVQTELGITGTTAQEASTTIQGSISAMKSAWSNLLTGMADPNQDLGKLMGNVVDSVITVADNAVPRIVALLPRLAQGVTSLIQQFVPMLPPLIQQLLPSVIEGAMALLDGVVQALPAVVTAIAAAVPMIVEGIVTMLPTIVDAGVQLILALVQGLGESLPTLIPAAVEAVLQIVDTLTKNIPLLTDAAIALMLGLANGLIAALPVLIEKAPVIIVQLVTALVANLPKIVEGGGRVILSLAQGISNSLPRLRDAGRNMISGLWQGIQNAWGTLKQNFENMVSSLVDGVENLLGIHSPSTVFAGIGKNMALGLEGGWDAELKSVSADINKTLTFEPGTSASTPVGGGVVINIGSFANYDTSTDIPKLVNMIAEQLGFAVARKGAAYAAPLPT